MEKVEPPKKQSASKIISLVMIVIAVLIFGLGYFFYVKPAADKAAELSTQDISALETRRDDLMARLLEAKKLQKSYSDPSDETLIKLKEALPSEPREIDLYVNLSEIIVQSGMEVKDIRITVPEKEEVPFGLQPVGTTPTLVREVKISLSMEGMSYTNMKRLIRNLESNSRLLRMERLVINPASSSYNVDLVAYFLEI